MKWRNLGCLFNTAEYRLPFGCTEFAVSPQALVCDDRVRVYFSTRQRDRSGKLLSQVAFVDMDKSLQHVLQVSREPVIELGSPGTFDEHGIFPFSPVRVGDLVHAYTTGWSRRVSVSADAAIGFATSRDGGLTFEKPGPGPILAASLHEPFLIGDAFVLRHGDRFHMWYIFGTRWTTRSHADGPERVYKIAHATSGNGVDWVRDSRPIVPDRLNDDECQALPTVIEIRGRHHMFFCYREAFDFRRNPANAYRLGHAVSDDLVHWQREDGAVPEVSATGWDADMQCYPNAFECDGKVYLLYNGNDFGRHGFGGAVLEPGATD